MVTKPSPSVASISFIFYPGNYLHFAAAPRKLHYLNNPLNTLYTFSENKHMHIVSLLHQLRDPMFHLLELFSGVLLVTLPAVPGGGHALTAQYRMDQIMGL